LPARLYKLFKYVGIKTKPLSARLYKLLSCYQFIQVVYPALTDR
jgi:hypothetical protein